MSLVTLEELRKVREQLIGVKGLYREVVAVDRCSMQVDPKARGKRFDITFKCLTCGRLKKEKNIIYYNLDAIDRPATVDSVCNCIRLRFETYVGFIVGNWKIVSLEKLRATNNFKSMFKIECTNCGRTHYALPAEVLTGNALPCECMEEDMWKTNYRSKFCGMKIHNRTVIDVVQFIDTQHSYYRTPQTFVKYAITKCDICDSIMTYPLEDIGDPRKITGCLHSGWIPKDSPFGEEAYRKLKNKLVSIRTQHPIVKEWYDPSNPEPSHHKEVMAFMIWAKESGYDSLNLRLTRKDITKPYGPDNCYWKRPKGW